MGTDGMAGAVQTKPETELQNQPVTKPETESQSQPVAKPDAQKKPEVKQDAASGRKPAAKQDSVEILGSRRTVFYTIITTIYFVIAKLFFFMRFEGKENIPKGPVILMANHQTFLDPLTLGICVWDREIHFMGKKELFENKILGWCFTHLHAFPVDRGSADMGAIRTAMNIVKSGDTLGIFPEGTRSKTGYMGPLLGGSSLLALKSGVEILPVYIDGRYKIFRPMRVIVGKPIEMGDLRSGRMNKESCDILTHRMEAAFAHLSGGKSLMPTPKKDSETQNS